MYPTTLNVVDASLADEIEAAFVVVLVDSADVVAVQLPFNVQASCQYDPVPGAYAQAAPLHQPEYG